MRPPPAILALAGVGALIAVAYPFAVERALLGLAPRAVSAAVLAAGALSLALPLGGRLPRAIAWLRGTGLALPALGLLTGDPLYPLLVPAAVQAVLAGVFLLSLSGGGSILREAARALNPYAPDWIAPYCRKVTLIFAAILALQGAALVHLALHPPQSWALLSGVAVWAPLGFACLVEWAVRKSYFRYYGEGPLDRRLRRLLPPTRTAPGRRSLEYIRAMRSELGMPPPGA